MTVAVRNLPTDSKGWAARAQAAAPMVPPWVHRLVASFLANPHADSDALLLLADALDEAVNEAMSLGWTSLARDLRALAEEPRLLAPVRVRNVQDDFL